MSTIKMQRDGECADVPLDDLEKMTRQGWTPFAASTRSEVPAEAQDDAPSPAGGPARRHEDTEDAKATDAKDADDSEDDKEDKDTKSSKGSADVKVDS